MKKSKSKKCRNCSGKLGWLIVASKGKNFCGIQCKQDYEIMIDKDKNTY